jgi:hypothetical protein
MKITATIVLLMAFSFGLLSFRPTGEKPVRVHRWIVQPASTLRVTGKTNVNKFSCQIQSYCGADTLILQDQGTQPPRFLKGDVWLEAAGFSCGNAMMTNDFHKTIQTKAYPQIAISFVSLERFPSYTCRNEFIKSNMVIALAGVARTFEVDCIIEAESNGVFHLVGNRCFQFSDFNLEAPSRMFGMIKVEEALDVSFHLVLRGS